MSDRTPWSPGAVTHADLLFDRQRVLWADIAAHNDAGRQLPVALVEEHTRVIAALYRIHLREQKSLAGAS